MFHYSLLEHSLINALMFERAIVEVKAKTVTTHEQWSIALDRHFDHSKAFTFGNLVKALVKYRDFQPFEPDLSSIKKSRDYFAHHFFRDEIAYFGSDEGRWFLLEKMNEERLRVNRTEKALQPVSYARLKRVGIPYPTEEVFNSEIATAYVEAQARVLDGKATVGWEANR